MKPSSIPDILPPFSSPQWCDHGPIVKTCSRCDPSEHSGRIRAREARQTAARLTQGMHGQGISADTFIAVEEQGQE